MISLSEGPGMSRPIRILSVFLVILMLLCSCTDEPEKVTAINETGSVSISTAIKGLSSDHDSTISHLTLTTAPLFVQNEITGIVSEQRITVDSDGHAAFGVMSQGQWRFTLKAFNLNGDLLYTGVTQAYIAKGTDNTVAIDLNTYTTGSGTLSINLTSITLTDPTLVIQYMKPGGSWSNLTLTTFSAEEITGGSINYRATASLQTGPYIISFQLKSGEGVTVGGETLNTHIFENGTTRITGNFTVAGDDGNFIKIMPGETVTFPALADQINISPTDLCRGFYIYGSSPGVSIDFPYTNTSADIQYAMPITAGISDYFNYSNHTATSKGASSALKYVAFGIDLTTIGESAFENGAILDVVSYAPAEIGGAAFKNSNVRYISLTETTTIGNQAFYGCSGLTSITITPSVTTIGSQAFQSSGLTEIAVPSTVTSVGASAFRACSNLRTVTWNGADIPDYAFTDSGVTTATVSVEDFGTAAFSGCRSLTTMEFPEGTKTIGNQAFANTSLAAVRIPTSATTIGEDAFSSTQLLASIHIEKPYDSILGKPWGSNAVVSWANYILTFESNGSQQFPATVNPTSKVISYGGTYGTLPDGNLNGSWDVSRTGHTLIGWFTSISEGTRIYPTTEYTLVTSSSVYAHWQANKYHVSFNTNAGSLYNTTNDITVSSGNLSSKEITYGQTYGTLPVISKTGYTFEGWFTAASGGDKVESGTQVLVLADQTLYAHWTANRVSVGFSNNLPVTGGGTTVSTMQTYGSKWSLPASPTYTGYTFTGWTDSPSGGNAITADDIFHSATPTTVYAQWSAVSYTVTLNTNATSLYNKATDIYVAGTSNAPAASIQVTYDSTYSALPTLSKRGFTFNGWYTAASGGTRVNSTDTVRIVANQTLYAHWTALTFDVTFHNNLPDGSDGTTVITETYGSKWRLASDPTYTGYTKRRSGSYSTWYDGENNAYTANNTFSAISDMDVYARWDANSYTITLNLNSDPLYKKASDIYVKNTTNAPAASISVTYGSTYSALPDLSKAGYTFNGWWTASSGGSRVNASDTVSTASSQTFYAHWTANTYTATFTLTGGNIGGNTANVTKTETYGALMTVPANPERTGYTFTSWKDSVTTDTYTSSTTYPFAADRTINATWTAKTYTTTYVPNNSYVTQGNNYSFTTTAATANTEKTQSYGSTRELPDQPSRTGFTFGGWYSSASGGTAASATIPAYDETLYAHWTPVQMQVIYVYNDDTSFTLNTTQIFNQKYTHPTQNKTKTGMTFAGWYFDQGCSVAVGENVVGKTENHSIYARWTYNDYQATFDANGGKFPDNTTLKVITQTYASRYSMPSTNPTRTGYDFLKWNLSSNGSGVNVTSSVYVTTPSDHSVYAVWDPWKFTITFDINAGSLYKTDTDISGSWNSITATYDQALGTLPNPSKPGYTFDGWYIDGTKITAATISNYTSDKTAVAHWTANTYTLTYDANAGSLYNTTTDLKLDSTLWASATKTQTFTYGQAMTGLKSMSKPGYTFNGLYSTSNTTDKKYTAASVYDVAGPMTVYGNWTANTYTVTYDANAGTLYNTTTDLNLGGTAWASATKTQTFTYGSRMTALKSAGKTGYTFNGWYTAASGGTQRTTSTVYDTVGDSTIYGHWTAVQITGTFNTNYPDGTSTTSTKTETYGSAMQVPSDPSFAGYSFLGWFTSASGGTRVTASTVSTYTSNMTFYAHWTSKVITLNVNASGLYNTNTDIYDGSTKYTGGTTGINTAHKYTNLPTLTKAGYTFNGWYDAASGGTRITTDNTYSVDTLYAHWTALTYTVTLNLNASSLYNTTTDIKNGSNAYTSNGSLTVTYGSTYSSLPTLSKPGHVFNGWYTATSGGTKINSTDNVVITANTTYYAHWNAVTTTATFHTNYPDATDSTTTKTETYGTKWVVESNPSFNGWTFDGWFSAASGGTQVTADDTNLDTTDRNLYAHWTTKTITLNVNASSLYNTDTDILNGSTRYTGGTTTITTAHKYASLPTLTKTGYSFSGWYSATSGGTKITTNSDYSVSTLYARWSANWYDIEMCLNADDLYNGTSDIERWIEEDDEWVEQDSDFEIELRYGSSFEGTLDHEADLYKPGYYFEGWYTAAGDSMYEAMDGSIWHQASGDTYYAHWDPRTYTLTFNGNKGSGSSSVSLSQTSKTVTYGEPVGTLPTPSRTGYVFTGWYDEP